MKKILRPFWRLYKFLILKPLFDLKDTWFIWKLRNRKSVFLQKNYPLPLNDVQKRITSELQKDGISITSIEELFPGSDLLSRLQKYGNELKEKAFQNPTKRYWMDMWDVKAFPMDLENPFLEIAMEEKVISISNAYLGMYSKLHSLGLSETIPVPEGTPASQSQRWHRDTGNKKYVKMFIYLNDVNQETGPFTYLKKSQPGGRWYKLFPQLNPYSEKSGRVEDDELAAAVPAEDILCCTGKAGALVFADTVGLHKGSYSTKGSRFASIITYYSEHSMETGKRERLVYPEGFAESISERSKPVKFTTIV